MPTRRLTSDELQVRLLPVFKRHQIVKAILFGLMACEEASRRSDFDLILVQRTSRRSWGRSAPLLCELNLALPEVAPDAVVCTPEELAYIAGRRFVALALRESGLQKRHVAGAWMWMPPALAEQSWQVTWEAQRRR